MVGADIIILGGTSPGAAIKTPRGIYSDCMFKAMSTGVRLYICALCNTGELTFTTSFYVFVILFQTGKSY